MTISELIAKLQEAKGQHGDLSLMLDDSCELMWLNGVDFKRVITADGCDHLIMHPKVSQGEIVLECD